jgi:hypothetical protein
MKSLTTLYPIRAAGLALVVLLAGSETSAAAIPAGARLTVRLNSALSTRHNPAGSTFTATLTEPLMDGDRVVAPKGAEVDGRVLESNPGGRIKGRATIAVRLTRIHGAENRTIPIHTSSVRRTARSTRKRDALTIGGGAGTGAGIGALAGGGIGAAVGAGAGASAGAGAVLLTRGAPAVIRSESVLVFRLQSPVKLEQPAGGV